MELERYIDGAGAGVGVRFRKLDEVGVELSEKKPELSISVLYPSITNRN